jgi:hypothetical protein
MSRLVSFLKDKFQMRQELCKETGTRYYGDGGTIHHDNLLDVEVYDGHVVGVWFRCQALPFQETIVDSYRANEMRPLSHLVGLHGVEVKDNDANV